MAFQQSPGVKTVEIDLSTVITGVATTGGVLAGRAKWGPAYERTLIDSEITYVDTFGKPDNDCATDFFTGSSFLQYGNNLTFVRCLSSAARNSCVHPTGVTLVSITNPGAGYTVAPTIGFSGGNGTSAAATATVSGGQLTTIAITNPGTGYTGVPSVTVTPNGADTPVAATLTFGSGDDAVLFTARTSGFSSNSISVKFVDPAAANQSLRVSVLGNDITVYLATGAGPGNTISTDATEIAAAITSSTSANALVHATVPGSGALVVTAHSKTYLSGGSGVGSLDTAVLTAHIGLVIKNLTDYENNYAAGQGGVGEFAARCAGNIGNSLTVSMADAGNFDTWTYKSWFDGAPNTSEYVDGFGGVADELHVVVVDTNGLWSGVPGEVIERYAFVSKASDAKTAQGDANYYPEAIARNSKYVYWMDHPAAGTNWGSPAAGTTFAALSVETDFVLSGGVDGNATLTDGNLEQGYDLFLAEEFDFALLLTSDHSANVVQYCVDSIAEVRQDCVVFLSPPKAAVVNNPGHEHTDTITYRNQTLNVDSSYAFMTCNWLKKYDRYNDVYRWIPDNGDIAGLCVRTDETRDPWFSPAGLNRGIIKGVRGLAWNPREAYRDILYQSGVNPVVSFSGQGVVLYGDKTMLAKPSAFNRINVRRLFIVVRKAVAAAAKYILFEFNDEITRAQFRALVDPFMRDVQGRRGIYAYRVVCDGTNNTPQVIDTNSFRGDIYIQPARSINFILLNFIATRTGISFDEVVGKF